eukprot:365721-Chlamydomonas_euryale.AAC.7
MVSACMPKLAHGDPGDAQLAHACPSSVPSRGTLCHGRHAAVTACMTHACTRMRAMQWVAARNRTSIFRRDIADLTVPATLSPLFALTRPPSSVRPLLPFRFNAPTRPQASSGGPPLPFRPISSECISTVFRDVCLDKFPEDCDANRALLRCGGVLRSGGRWRPEDAVAAVPPPLLDLRIPPLSPCGRAGRGHEHAQARASSPQIRRAKTHAPQDPTRGRSPVSAVCCRRRARNPARGRTPATSRGRAVGAPSDMQLTHLDNAT